MDIITLLKENDLTLNLQLKTETAVDLFSGKEFSKYHHTVSILDPHGAVCNVHYELDTYTSVKTLLSQSKTTRNPTTKRSVLNTIEQLFSKLQEENHSVYISKSGWVLDVDFSIEFNIPKEFEHFELVGL